MSDYELFEGCWRPVRDDRPDVEPETVWISGQRNVCVSYSYDEDKPQAVYDDCEIWWNAALWPTFEELEAWWRSHMEPQDALAF